MHQSDDQNDYYYHQQIVKNANEHLDYFANTAEYRSWAALSMRWNGSRQCKMAFTLHAIGRPFNGSLICAPFLEFRDRDGDDTQASLTPIAEEGFVFFYNEEQSRLLSRFRAWRDNAIKVALKELENNLW